MNKKTGGLYIPVSFPKMNADFLKKTPNLKEIAFEMAKPYVEGEIPDSDLMALIEDAYPFDAPVVKVDSNSYILELFHGPTCAFKDFGARFMARAMSYFNRSESTPLHILVATSGDTGSAVGSAFHNVPGLDVTILYPEGKISPLQEKQLSTFDGNVRALKLKGTFDDCQTASARFLLYVCKPQSKRAESKRRGNRRGSKRKFRKPHVRSHRA